MNDNDRRTSGSDDAVYALVDAALREDPGFVLPPGFPDRVALKALQPRGGFHWFEHVILPLLLTLPIVFLHGAIAGVAQSVLPGVGGIVLRILALFPPLSIDGVIYAGASLLFTAVVDRVLRRRLRAEGLRVLA